jgi:hypothetical protein
LAKSSTDASNQVLPHLKVENQRVSIFQSAAADWSEDQERSQMNSESFSRKFVSGFFNASSENFVAFF